jgi:NAD(P)-dependent dehydrogenase (short-subunit alcohol dehydrogenase family)
LSATVLVLGATSAIAIAYCRRLADQGASFTLVARRKDRLDTIAGDLKARGAGEAVTIVSDLADLDSAEARFREFCQPLGMPDQVLIAYGVLGEQEAAEDSAEATRKILDVNFTSAALWLQMAAKLLPRDRPRFIVVIGSVAGDRGRRSNYVYGAAKAGLAAFAEGLAHRLHGTPLHVLLVKPGFVDTPMTAHMPRGGPLWAKPEQIAENIEKALRRKQTVAYTPRFWWPIMTVIRFLPRPIFFRTKL